MADPTDMSTISEGSSPEGMVVEALVVEACSFRSADCSAANTWHKAIIAKAYVDGTYDIEFTRMAKPLRLKLKGEMIRPAGSTNCIRSINMQCICRRALLAGPLLQRVHLDLRSAVIDSNVLEGQLLTIASYCGGLIELSCLNSKATQCPHSFALRIVQRCPLLRVLRLHTASAGVEVAGQTVMIRSVLRCAPALVEYNSANVDYYRGQQY
jgi:hypothetical protein